MVNPGSAMRDLLANERTLLAWVRTALVFMGFGLTVEKFTYFFFLAKLQAGLIEASDMAAAPMGPRILGIILIVFGGLIAAGGALRTRRWAASAARLESAPPTWPLIATSLATAALSVMLVIHVITSAD